MADPSKFSLELEIWSRKTDKAMWLSAIGHRDIIRRMPDGVECEKITPTEDYVLTEFLMMAPKEQNGISYISVTFSEDYGAPADIFSIRKQEVFTMGLFDTSDGTSFMRIDDFS